MTFGKYIMEFHVKLYEKVKEKKLMLKRKSQSDERL